MFSPEDAYVLEALLAARPRQLRRVFIEISFFMQEFEDRDVGTVRSAPLRAGQVFSIDPMMWVPEERLYVRMEDVVVVTADGVENFTADLPVRPDDIEAVMKKK